MKAILMLEDGKAFPGESLGSSAEAAAEVAMNTAVVGFQEMLTDPANAAKILVFTYPLIGNYGVAGKFNESKKAWVSGLVIKEKSNIFSNWQARSSFSAFLEEQKIPCICAVDTRTLAVHLRQKGALAGIISTKEFDPKALLQKIKSFRARPPVSLLPEISVKKPQSLGGKKGKFKIAVLDLGVTNSTLRQLEILGASFVLLPYDTRAEDILRLKVKGLVISSGPEADCALEKVIENIRPLVGRLPLLGIATGHQVLAACLGAKLVKLKLGHRGANYPVQSPASYKGEITVQNHSYAVDADSLSKLKTVKVTAYNLNDRSVEEIESRRLKIIGAQYCLCSPGFDEVNGVFKRFFKMLKKE